MEILISESIKIFKQNFKNNIKKCKFEKHGIWPSEMFMFCGLCDLHDIDIIIESGTANGCSTRILVHNFPNKEIYTIEFPDFQQCGNGYPDFCKESEQYNNLTLLNGDSFNEIPKLMNQIGKNKKVAILIDGPKNNHSLLLYY